MRGVRFAGLLGMAVVVSALAGCVDEEIVYRDKPLFEDPPQAAVGFLGYSNTEQKKTTCGNCHAGQQVAWQETKHSHAWASLQANPGKKEYCYDCHTVSALGNAAAGTKVGYSATADKRYEDVQCESCHGAGLEHVGNPSNDAIKPMASMATGTDKTNGCGECHSGSHSPFVEEWQGSVHSRTNETVKTNAAYNPAYYTSCLDCHDGRAAMKNKFGVKNAYAEQNDGKYHGTTCIVCHDPHGNGKTAQLRMDPNSRDGKTNLCYQCHNRGPVPTGAIVRNYPHAPQGPLVLGDPLGWKPPGFTTEKLISTHGSEANKGLCTTCHMANYAVTATVNTTGHMFEAIPCKDASGLLTNAKDCQMSARSFKSCTGSGCHGTETAARSAILASESRLNAASAELKRLVAAAKATDKGAADWKADTNLTPVEGADFNSLIMYRDRSRGAHNPFYVDALLTASISYIKTYYGVQ